MKRHGPLPMLLLAGSLSACSPHAPAVTQAADAAHSAPSIASDTGRRIFDANCVPCHQQNGRGIPGVYPSLVGSPVVLGDPAPLARWVIKGQRPASMPLGRYPTQMLQFGWLKAADAAALFTYLRSSFGNSAPPVDASVVVKALGQ